MDASPLSAIAGRLAAAARADGPLHGGIERPLPSRRAVDATMAQLRAALLPGYGHLAEGAALEARIAATLAEALPALEEQVYQALCFMQPLQELETSREGCRDNAGAIVARFANALPMIQGLLAGDAEAAYLGDPAAVSPYEPALSYPGFYAVTNHRVAHALHLFGVPLLPRLISELAHGRTGIDIHPGAAIGERFFIDHGTGVVIGETCEIGARVKIYQGVTLGALSFPLDELGNPVKGVPRHPIVEDDVTIYSGATVLGRVTIGAGSVIGGNVWLTHDVPPDSRVYQARARQESFHGGAGI